MSLSNISNGAFIANADKKALINEHVAESFMTFFRPHVSAIKPQKCELITIPRKAIDDTRPNSVVVIFKSQFAYGRTKATLIFSIVAPINATPDIAVISILNRPLPIKNVDFLYSLHFMSIEF